jgi:hypothetical protein
MAQNAVSASLARKSVVVGFMKLKTFLFVVGLAVLVVAAYAVHSQVTPKPLRSFFVLETMSSPQSDSPYPQVWTRANAVRENGSWVLIAYLQNLGPKTTFERDVFDFERGVLTIIVEPTESIQTRAISAHEMSVRKINPVARCEGSSAGQILGFDVDYSETRNSTLYDEGAGISTHINSVIKKWAAPDLGCFVLRKETIQTRDDGTLTADTRIQALSVTFQPVDQFFEIPASYIERSPSEIDRELNRRYPQQYPVIPNDAAADASYHAAHDALRH